MQQHEMNFLAEGFVMYEFLWCDAADADPAVQMFLVISKTVAIYWHKL